MALMTYKMVNKKPFICHENNEGMSFMPQLDHVSYFSQFFWLSLAFLSFYIVLVKTLLPRVATILKVRKKLMLGTEQKVDNLSVAKNEEISGYDKVLLQSLREARNLLAETSKNSSQWIASTNDKINGTNLVTSQEKFVESVGDILSKKYLLQSLLK